MKALFFKTFRDHLKDLLSCGPLQNQWTQFIHVLRISSKLLLKWFAELFIKDSAKLVKIWKCKNFHGFDELRRIGDRRIKNIQFNSGTWWILRLCEVPGFFRHCSRHVQTLQRNHGARPLHKEASHELHELHEITIRRGRCKIDKYSDATHSYIHQSANH